MKRLFVVIIFAAALTACVNRMEINVPDAGSYLILNAMLSDDETSHTVHLSYCNGADMLAPSGAEVTLLVNGSEYSAADWTDGSYSTAYFFDAELKPGDVMRIDASYRGYTAYAEVEVPQRAEIVSVDTLRRVNAEVSDYSYGSGRLLQFVLGIRDVPGEKSWYRLTLERDFEFAAHFYEYPERTIYSRPDSTYSEVSQLRFDIGSDKILLDDYLPDSSSGSYDGAEELLNLFNPHNTTRIFTDERFTDSGAEVKFEVDSLDFVPYYPGMEFWRYDAPEYAGKCYSSYEADVHPSARVRLQSISFDAYTYFRAINSCETFGYETNPLIEPTTIPSNVVGGLGFVSVASISSAVVDFPQCHVLQPGGKPGFLEGE